MEKRFVQRMLSSPLLHSQPSSFQPPRGYLQNGSSTRAGVWGPLRVDATIIHVPVQCAEDSRILDSRM